MFRQTREVPLSWFGKTLWKFTPLYVELVFLAICIRLLGLFEPFILQVIIDRILPFEREATLIVVMAIFAAVSLFHIGFSVLSSLLGMLTANRVTRELGGRIFEHLFRLPYSHFRKWPIGETIARVGETDTIQSRLLKLAGRIGVTVRRVWLSFASVFPLQDVFEQALANLRTASATLRTVPVRAPPG